VALIASVRRPRQRRRARGCSLAALLVACRDCARRSQPPATGRTKPFGEIRSRGVFVGSRGRLLEGRIDVAVHSAKDMTSSDVEGLVVGVPAARGPARRALRRGELRPGMRMGLPGPQARNCSRPEPDIQSSRCAGTSTRDCVERGARSRHDVLAACGSTARPSAGPGIASILTAAGGGRGALALQRARERNRFAAAIDDGRRAVASRASAMHRRGRRRLSRPVGTPRRRRRLSWLRRTALGSARDGRRSRTARADAGGARLAGD
jgi:hypothetical protein